MKARPVRRAAVKKAGVKKTAAKKAGVKSADASVNHQAADDQAAASQATEARSRTTVAFAESATDSAGQAAPAAIAAGSRRAGLRLEPSCTLRDALDMQFQLLATDFGDSDVLLDGSAVERIDTAGLQMLVAFAKHHAASGRRMQWTAASQELQRGSHLLGLDEALGLIPSPPEVSGGH